MTIPNNKMKQSFNGDGVTVLFPFTGISFYQTADLDVLIADAAGVETVLTQNVDYTITNCGAGLPYTQGDITMIGAYAIAPPASGEKVVVYRDVAYTQEIDLVAGGAMAADTLEEGYDRGVMQIQQLYDLIGRTVTLPISSGLTGLTLPTPVAEYFLRWNALANNLENFNIADLSLYSVSAFAETLLDDADAATARATLGVTLANLGLDADLATFSVPASTTISAFGKTLVDDADAATARATLEIPTQILPTNHLSGLTIAHAADTEHDITVAAGKARDATDAADMVLAAAITKQFDAAWAVGDAAGGFAAGESLPASGTIHIWLIKRSDTGVVDVMANNHATSGLTPTLPTDYDYKRRIFSLRTDASNNIINGDQWGTGLVRTWMYDTPILDVAATNPGTSAVTAALSVPGGIIVSVLGILALTRGTSTNVMYVSSLANADLAPSVTAAPLGNWAFGTPYANPLQDLLSNASSQIRYRIDSSGAADVVRLATYGWRDSL